MGKIGLDDVQQHENFYLLREPSQPLYTNAYNWIFHLNLAK